ncbi:hypothetical protein D3C85_848470 [compost metagenome]
MDAFDKAVEGVAELAEFVLVLDAQAAGQVAFTVGNVLHGAGHDVQRLDQDTDQHAQQGNDDGDRDHRGHDRRGAEIVEHGVGFVLVHRQADVPVDRWQAFDGGEGDNARIAIDLDFGEVAADARGVMWEGLGEGLHHQGFVRVHQDLAVGADQEGIAHAVEVQGLEVVDQGLQAQVAPHDTHAFTGFFRGRGDGNNGLAGCRIDIGFGQGSHGAVFSAFVPGANTRVEAVRHFHVRADGEAATGVTQVGRHESRRQGFLFQQCGNLGVFGVDGDVLG